MEDWVTAANVAWATTYMLMENDAWVKQYFSSNCFFNTPQHFSWFTE